MSIEKCTCGCNFPDHFRSAPQQTDKPTGSGGSDSDSDVNEQRFRQLCIDRAGALTKRQILALRACLTDEIVESGPLAAVGDLVISTRTVNALLACCAIKQDSFGYYAITDIGRELLQSAHAPKPQPEPSADKSANKKGTNQ